MVEKIDYTDIVKLLPELTALKAPPELSAAQQLEMFRTMILIREFETSVIDLWKKNLIYGLAHTYIGAEAIAVGACTALREGDLITSTHRGHGHVIAKGGDVNKMMAELMGKYVGYNRGKGGSMHIAAVEKGMLGACGIVASGMPIAVGAALTAKVLHRDYVAVAFHGDGGTNQGVWHESINMAAAWDLPVIFLCENNQWAISMPYGKASKNPDIAARAIGYGIPGVTVDGFNPFAVYSATKEAAGRAREGKGPTLLVAKFYRYVGHHVGDDHSVYRDLKTNEPWMKLDPVSRMTEYLLASGVALQKELEAIRAEARKKVDNAIEFAKNAAEPSPDRLFDDLYAPD